MFHVHRIFAARCPSLFALLHENSVKLEFPSVTIEALLHHLCTDCIPMGTDVKSLQDLASKLEYTPLLLGKMHISSHFFVDLGSSTGVRTSLNGDDPIHRILMSSHLRQYVNKESFSDVQLKSKDGKIFAHKLVSNMNNYKWEKRN